MKKSVLFLALLSFSAAVSAQTLMTVGNQNISKADFLAIYNKNNKNEKATEASIKEYLGLYTNFRLKVAEAETQGLDTSVEFKRELAGYRKQLAQPYLIDKDASEALLREAYFNSTKEVRASHILINCAADIGPADTLRAYNRAMAARKRIVEGKEDFGVVAAATSDDPSAKTNKGDLGYFTAFTMVYPFEKAAYSNTVGAISMPVRTKYGYHIIKTTDIRPAQGEMKAAHIMVRTQAGMAPADSIKAAERIQELYKKVKAGENFEELAKQFSEDKNSARSGGLLQVFNTGKMVPEFENAAYALKNNGDISAPIKTAYGWHIIKRLDLKPVPAYETIQNDIKAKVNKDSRSDLNKVFFITKLKREYNFRTLQANIDAMAKPLIVDSAIFKAAWKLQNAEGYSATVMTIGNKNFTQFDFAKYIAANQTTDAKATPISLIINRYFNQYAEKSLLETEENSLDGKYPEFKALIKEYRDGILLFELTDKTIWSKATSDTTGLKNFYNTNKTNYMWKDRTDATIYTCANEAVAAKVRKLLNNKKVSQDSILRSINKENPANLSIVSNKFEKGDNATIDKLEAKKGVTKNFKEGSQTVFVNIKNIIPAEPKALSEVRGSVTADYQRYLEEQWLKELRSKYAVSVNQDVLKTLYQ